MGIKKRSEMRPIEKLPEGELAVLFFKIEDGPDEGHTIVVIGDWATTVENKRMWFVTATYSQIMYEYGLFGKEPTGWYPLPKI